MLPFTRINAASCELVTIGDELPKVQPGDFFLIHGSGILSNIIQLGQSFRFRGKDSQFAQWTHTGIFISPDGDFLQAEATGVKQRSLVYYKGKKLLLVHINASVEDREEAVDFAKACIGQEYGWSTIVSIAVSFLFGLKFSFGFDGEEICSGLVARALERTTAIFPRDASHITPADLASYYHVAS